MYKKQVQIQDKKKSDCGCTPKDNSGSWDRAYKSGSTAFSVFQLLSNLALGVTGIYFALANNEGSLALDFESVAGVYGLGNAVFHGLKLGLDIGCTQNQYESKCTMFCSKDKDTSTKKEDLTIIIKKGNDEKEDKPLLPKH
jgi:hypothetical protein